MRVLAQLLRVASEVEGPLRARILEAALKVAIEDDIDPNGVSTPLVVDEKDPLSILDTHKDVIHTLFDEKNTKDPMVVAATSLPMTLAALVKQLETLRDGVIPEETEDEDTSKALGDFKVSIEDIHGQLNDMTTWMQRVSDIATEVPESPAPKFPSLPKSIKPNYNAERDKLPVIVDKEEDEEDELVEEDPVEEDEESEHPLDNILKELG